MIYHAVAPIHAVGKEMKTRMLQKSVLDLIKQCSILRDIFNSQVKDLLVEATQNYTASPAGHVHAGIRGIGRKAS